MACAQVLTPSFWQVFLVMVLANIKVVEQGTSMIVERFGRFHKRVRWAAAGPRDTLPPSRLGIAPCLLFLCPCREPQSPGAPPRGFPTLSCRAGPPNLRR